MKGRLLILGGLLLLDRLVKSYIWFLKPKFLGDFLYPQLNYSIAFSLPLPDSLLVWLGPIIAVIIGWLVWVCWRQYQRGQTDFFYWGLIVAGAVSNVIDRLTLGAVFDYINLGWWPVFNISDAYIAIGVAALVSLEIKKQRRLSAAA